MLENLEDIPEEFKGGTLEIQPSKTTLSHDKLESPTDSLSGQNRSNNLISPVSIPQRSLILCPSVFKLITATIWRGKSPDSNKTIALNENVRNSTSQASDFFTSREAIVEQAVNECVEQFLDPEADGPFVGAFLLTEISLWDADKERLLLLTTKSMVTVKYDFIALKRLEYKKLPLDCIDTIVVGNLIYPPSSLIPRLNGLADGFSAVIQNYVLRGSNNIDNELLNFCRSRNRNSLGVRLMWNNGKPMSLGNMWNPFNNNVLFSTYTSHPLSGHKDVTNELQKKMYSVDEFIEKICSLVEDLNENNNRSAIINPADIVLNNYVSLGSLIHNRNALGFFKVRGKFSF